MNAEQKLNQRLDRIEKKIEEARLEASRKGGAATFVFVCVLLIQGCGQ